MTLTHNFHLNPTDPPSCQSEQLTGKYTFSICSGHIKDYQSESLGNFSDIEPVLEAIQHIYSRYFWSSCKTIRV